MKFKPNGSWVVLPDPSKQKTDSGIILDEKTAKSMNTNILEVLAAGPQCHFAKVGETVMVDPRSEAVIIHVDEKQYIMISEHQLLGKW
jgi:co-chaperonin GroES (HSP10)